MPAQDATLLEQGIKPCGLLFAGEYGFVFNTFIEAENWRTLGLSKELFANGRSVLARGFDRAEFDRDAEVVEGLPKYDW